METNVPVRESLLKRRRQFWGILAVLLLSCTALMYALSARTDDPALFRYAAGSLILIGAAGILASRCPACKKFALNIKNRRVFCKACKAEAEL